MYNEKKMNLNGGYSMGQTNREDIAREFMMSVWSIHNNVLRKQKLPLPLNQFVILMDLFSEPDPMTIHELSESLQIKKQQMTVIISRLETAGCISRTPKDSDRRYSEIKLTEKGIAVIKNYLSGMYTWFLQELDRLKPEHQQILSDSLHSFNNSLDILTTNKEL